MLVRRSGGIGRRAGFRCLWSQDRVGSSPISCINREVGERLPILFCADIFESLLAINGL